MSIHPAHRIWRMYRAVAPLLAVAAHCAAAEWNPPEPDERFGEWSVHPFTELEPGFAGTRATEFTLDLSGVGREALTMRSVKVNGSPLPEFLWNVTGSTLRIRADAQLQFGLNRFVIIYDHPPVLDYHTENPVEQGFFVNFQPSVPQLGLSERGEMMVDGQRVFVLGSYRSGQEDRFINALDSAVTAGFNVVHDYRFETFDMDGKGIEAYLDDARSYVRAAHQRGLGVFFGLHRRAVNTYEEDVLARVIAELSPEPGLWMWYIYDEPSPNSTPLWNAARTYMLLKRLDPGRPAVMLPNYISTMWMYSAYSDIVWSDRYPITATGVSAISLAPIAAHLQAFRQALDHMGMGKPVWPVLQVHDNKGIPSIRESNPSLPQVTDENHLPTEAEIRAQSHLALANHSPALIYYWGPHYWYSMLHDTPGIWASLTDVLHELRDLGPVLLSEEPVPAVTLHGANDKVVFWSRRAGDNLYVGVVNSSVHEPEIFDLDPGIGFGEWEQIQGDGQSVRIQDRIRVELGGAQVAVLRLVEGAASEPIPFLDEAFDGSAGATYPGEDWIAYQGGENLFLENGALRHHGQGLGGSTNFPRLAYMTPESIFWRDYTVTTRFSTSFWNPDTSTWPGLLLRVQGELHFYEIRMQGQQLRIGYRNGGDWIPFATSTGSFTYVPGEIWTLRASAVGNQITAELLDAAGARVITVSGMDATFSMGAPGLAAGMSQEVAWHHLRVTAYSEPAPATPIDFATRDAVEIHFPTTEGFLYQIEKSTDLRNWSPVGDIILGDGHRHSGLVSARGKQREFFRVLRSEYKSVQ